MPNPVTAHVAAGEFIVDTQKPLQLEALLSSCVGVVLYDPENNVGGLSHFLLPEPISISNSTDFKKYASTGLQVFFNELIAQGAVTENLRAVIAGGAFSGNISQQDINLDIGGRTADIVKKILAQKMIKIETSETGGFFSCKLSLNMQNWETKIVPVTIDKDESKAPETISLDEIEQTFKTIQPIPQVALKILRMISENSSDFGDLAKEVKKDQVISAQVLKFCNSSIFGGRGRIDTISDALLIIGQNSLAKIIANIAVKNLITNTERGYSLVQGGLYHHSIGAALLSEKIAEKTGVVTPFSAYTAGLLHDIGKVALDQFFASAMPFFYRDTEEHQTTDMLGLENKYLGINHTVAGKKLSEIWGIPESISSVIEHHHTPQAKENMPAMVYIVALSNIILHMFKAKPEIVGVDMSNIHFLMEKLDIPTAEFSSLIDLIPIETLSSSPESVIF